jgi:hypothetical protein
MMVDVWLLIVGYWLYNVGCGLLVNDGWLLVIVC